MAESWVLQRELRRLGVAGRRVSMPGWSASMRTNLDFSSLSGLQPLLSSLY